MIKIYSKNRESLLKTLADAEAEMKAKGIENPTIEHLQELADEKMTDYISQSIRRDVECGIARVMLV